MPQKEFCNSICPTPTYGDVRLCAGVGEIADTAKPLHGAMRSFDDLPMIPGAHRGRA